MCFDILSFMEKVVITTTTLTCEYHNIELPLTNLFYVKCGTGPAMILLPATISRVKEWLPLVQFFAQKNTVYFFELPGHGNSSAFEGKFTTQKVAQTVEDFMDILGIEQATIGGFSFGGLLTMRTVYHLKNRLDAVVLYAPVITKRALLLPKVRLFFVEVLLKIIRIRFSRVLIINLFKSDVGRKFIDLILHKFGRVDACINAKGIVKKVTEDTLDVLSYQLSEVLNLTWPVPSLKIDVPCYFGMSINDTMLDYNITFEEVKKHFSNIKDVKFTFPYHQIPGPITLEDLNRDYAGFIDELLG